MHVGVGFSENPDTVSAGIEAAKQALTNAGREQPCDVALLFTTARHDAETLRHAVLSIIGKNVPVVGGGAVGVITNSQYGYAGDQVGIAVFWRDGISCRILAEAGLEKDETKTGERLGGRLAMEGVDRDTSVMLFYDAIENVAGKIRLLMATPMLAGLEKKLGFLPNMIGAGLQGDYVCTPVRQWVGYDTVEHQAAAMVFGRKLAIETTIMHGCRPATGYYSVTKADKQVVLEINHQPALVFIQNLLGPGIKPEEYAYFLIFGVNNGDRFGEFDETHYANRPFICFDRERNGIVMFEPDMVAGTQFQIMHRSMDLQYIAPRIEDTFTRIGDRKPVFAFYIDCAGRASGYAGVDLEDAVVVQKVVNNRVPLLGIYSGVEIAPVLGVPRPLDWTGVFCLFSVPTPS